MRSSRSMERIVFLIRKWHWLNSKRRNGSRNMNKSRMDFVGLRRLYLTWLSARKRTATVRKWLILLSSVVLLICSLTYQKSRRRAWRAKAQTSLEFYRQINMTQRQQLRTKHLLRRISLKGIWSWYGCELMKSFQTCQLRSGFSIKTSTIGYLSMSSVKVSKLWKSRLI